MVYRFEAISCPPQGHDKLNTVIKAPTPGIVFCELFPGYLIHPDKSGITDKFIIQRDLYYFARFDLAVIDSEGYATGAGPDGLSSPGAL